MQISTQLKKIALFILAPVSIFFFSVYPASADDIESSLVRGAKLYDKWFGVIKADKPKDTHDAWPASNTKKKGDTTWRCKSCHGWDYKGKDGAYSSGSYKTGIKGINALAGADTAKIITVLKDKAHKLEGKMGDQDFMDLALFVSKGQVDMSEYIDLANKSLKSGNATQGAKYYVTLCAQCHGKDGRLPKDMGKTLGAQMGNPWEVMHKILNGQPGEQMPALRALDRTVVVDIMAHLNALPKSK